MRTHARLLLVTAVTLGLAGWFLSAGNGNAADEKGGTFEQVIPEQEASKLIQQDADYIKEKLSKADPKSAKRARMAAIMIAVYAESTKGSAHDRMAGVRDTALQVAEAAKNKKYDDAMKDVDTLKALKGNGAAGVAFPKELDVEDIMRPFGLPTTGGLGIEKELLKLGMMKRLMPQADLTKRSEDLALYGYRAAAIAELAKRHMTEDAQKNASTRKMWVGWAEDMQKAAVEFSEAAKSKNPKNLKTAIVKLNNSCSACHQKFRTEE